MLRQHLCFSDLWIVNFMFVLFEILGKNVVIAYYFFLLVVQSFETQNFNHNLALEISVQVWLISFRLCNYYCNNDDKPVLLVSNICDDQQVILCKFIYSLSILKDCLNMVASGHIVLSFSSMISEQLGDSSAIIHVDYMLNG